MAEYTHPVNQLLTYGNAQELPPKPDYLSLGFSEADIPELIRMGTDSSLSFSDSDSLEVRAPLHCWRILGLLKAEAAVEPLLGLATEMIDDDWYNDEIPEIIAEIGPVAIPVIKKRLDKEATVDPEEESTELVSYVLCLKEITKAYPEKLEVCKAIIIDRLKRFNENNGWINGLLIDYLLEYNLVETAPLIEAAFEAKAVDLTLAGDWEDAQIELGLLKERKTPRRNYVLESAFPDPQERAYFEKLQKLVSLQTTDVEKMKEERDFADRQHNLVGDTLIPTIRRLKSNSKAKKDKRKMAKKSRKKNRKKKR